MFYFFADEYEIRLCIQIIVSKKTWFFSWDSQQLKSQNREVNEAVQSSILKYHHILVHRVFKRLKVPIEDKRLHCLFLFIPFVFDLRVILVHVFIWLIRDVKDPSESHHCSLTSPSYMSVLWSIKQGPLLSGLFSELALLLRRRMSCQSFWICLCSFPCLFLFSSPTDGCWMVWTDIYTDCRVTSRIMIPRHQCSLTRQLFHPWPICQVVFRTIIRDAGSVHAAVRVHSRERSILHCAFRNRTISQILSSLFQKNWNKQGYSFPGERKELISRSLWT